MKAIVKIYMTVVLMSQLSSSCFSQESLKAYSDSEIIKIVNHIKNLEKQNLIYSKLNSNNIITFVDNNIQKKDEFSKTADENNSVNYYDSHDVIKLASYIKYLENTQLQNATETGKSNNGNILDTESVLKN